MYVQTTNRPFLSILPLVDPGKLVGATGHALTSRATIQWGLECRQCELTLCCWVHDGGYAGIVQNSTRVGAWIQVHMYLILGFSDSSLVHFIC